MTIILITSIVVLDQLSKYVVTINESRLPYDIWPGIFSIQSTHNHGAAFSILQNKTYFFVAVAVIAIVMIIGLLNGIARQKAALAALRGQAAIRGIVFVEIALSLVMGGAIGNLIDRLRFGYVIDFLDFKVWPVFNIADSAITIGMIMLIFGVFKVSPCIR
ncbi:MAG: signal peptidase II [Candidatus Omnitrophica bacterium]|nr:signal peptidase II [Candidatus Omnitrophota bacterium]